MEKCGNCEFKKKLRSTTYYECKKFNKILTSNPPQKCDECMEESKPKRKTMRKDYIEVR